MNWGDYIKTTRTEKGLSVADLSLKSGIKDATIAQIERGQKNGGSIVIIEKILSAMGQTLTTTAENTETDEK